MTVRRIGLYGGTFDPIHVGHVHMALSLREQCALESVRLIPCATPVHRTAPGASAEQRCAMVERAIRGVDGLELDRRELAREGGSYTIDTVREIRDEYGAASSVQWYLLVGMDAFAKLLSWREWRALLDEVVLVLAPRAGAQLSPILLRELARRQTRARAPQSGQIVRLEMPLIDISATAQRSRLAQQLPCPLLHCDVAKYAQAIY